jgi:hypothetical protein
MMTMKTMMLAGVTIAVFVAGPVVVAAVAKMSVHVAPYRVLAAGVIKADRFALPL